MKIQGKSIILAATITALTTPMLANAVVKSSDPEIVSVTVRYNGYHLNSQEGKAIVERKIRKAAHKICGPTSYSELRSLRQLSANRACYDEAVENASIGLEKQTAGVE